MKKKKKKESGTKNTTNNKQDRLVSFVVLFVSMHPRNLCERTRYRCEHDHV